MPNLVLSPWRGGTPRKLAEALNAYIRTPDQFRDRPVHNIRTIINWGTHMKEPIRAHRTLNRPAAVAGAASKLMTFRIAQDAKLPTLEYTTDRAMALGWLPSASVFAHTNLHSHSGQGLVLTKKGAGDLPEAKVYTRYFPKKIESRTHVIRTGVGEFQHLYLEKRRISSERYDEFGIEESPTTYIRTYANGWIFAREVEEDPKAVELAVKAIQVFNLDYGAVDIMKDAKGQYVIGEINTAPGLEGQALAFYIEHLQRML